MKSILITGSNGYIGTNLVGYLRKDEYKIFGIDKATGTPAEFLDRIKGNCDCIVHLAALSGIQACEDDLVMAIRDNLSSAFNIFSLASYKNIPVVFLSSQAAKEPKSSIYAMMKHIIEVQARTMNSEYIANIKVLRLTNVYGGADYLVKKNTVVKKFIEAYKKGYPLIVDGNGDQTRDFIHVDDVCEYIRKCIEISATLLYRPVDIGTGVQTSINDMVKMFNTENVQYDISSRTVGVSTNVADTERAFEIFGYRPENKLQKYINEEIKKERIKDNV